MSHLLAKWLAAQISCHCSGCLADQTAAAAAVSQGAGSAVARVTVCSASSPTHRDVPGHCSLSDGRARAVSGGCGRHLPRDACRHTQSAAG